MANIDELHWSAILDTEDFDKKAKKLRSDAKALNKELNAMLNVYEKFKGKTLITEKGVKNAKELSEALSEIQQKMNSLPSSVRVYEKGTENVEKNVERTNRHYQTQSALLRQITTLAGTYFSIRGAERFLKSLVDITGEFEKQKMSLTSMLQSSDAADRIFNEYRQLALKSPYTFQDFTKFGKQLLAFNIPQEQLVGTTKMLADVAAGLGVDMGRIILAYGQIKSAGVLKGTELRQLTEAGVPILDSLAKQIEETTGKAVKLGDVYAMISKKQIPFEMVEEAFRRMTSEGGKFYNMQEVLVETLWGKIGKLRDVWQQALYDMGSGSTLNSTLKGAIDLVTRLVTHLDAIAKAVAPIIAGFGAYGAALAAAAIGQKALDLANFIKALRGVATGSTAAAKAITMLGGAGKMASLSLAALTVLGVAIAEIVKQVKKANDEANRLNVVLAANDKAIDDEVDKLDELNTKLKLNKKGTQDWIDAKNEALSSYGKYFDGLNNEIEKVGDLSTAYDTLKASIVDATKSRLVADFIQQEGGDLIDNEQLDKIREKVYKQYGRAKAYDFMYKLNRVLLAGDSYDVFRSIDGVGEMMNKARGTLGAEIIDIIRETAKRRENYVSDLRELVRIYGLQGTELDPDFNGPIPAKKQTKTTNLAGTGTTVTKEVEALYDWDKVLQELDKQLMDDIENDTKAFEKEFDKRMKALGEFDDFFEKLDMTGVKEGGEGVTGKVKNFLFDYRADDYKVLVEYRKQLGNLKTVFGENSKAYENAKKKLDDWRTSAEAANRTKLFEKVRELTDDIFKEGMAGYDLTNWNDKTLAQIEAIEDALNELDLPDDLKEELKVVSGLLEHAKKSFEDYKKKVQDNTITPAKTKDIIKSAKTFISYMNRAASAIKKLGEAADNTDLSKFGEVLDAAGDTWMAMLEGFEKGGAIGAVITGAATMIEKFVGYLAKAVEEENQMRNAVKEMQEEIRNMNFEEELKEGVESLFGDNAIKSINNATKAISELRSQWDELLDVFEKVRDSEVEHYMRATGGGAGGEILSAREAWKEQIRGIEDLVFSNGSVLMTIAEAADTLGLKLKDTFGNINPELLDRIIEVYKLEDGVRENRIDQDTLDYLKRLSEYGKDYAKAVEQIESAVSDLFGDIADNMVDAFLDNFKEMGNAVEDLGDTFTDLGETIVKSMLKSYILDTILKKYEDEAKSMMQAYATGGISYDELAQRVGAFAEAVTEDTRAAGDVINAMLAAFQERGLLGEGGEKDTLANGFKGITENTAGLLASYLNAVRADVSYVRMMQEKGWADVSGIYEAMGAFPTLNDYMAQVAASNYDIAESNRQILTELQSVITSASGRRSIAVDVQ